MTKKAGGPGSKKTNGRVAVAERSSISGLAYREPWLAEWLGVSVPPLAGVEVNATTALGLTAFWRGVHIIAGTVAGLPLKTYRDRDGIREQASSFLDNPWPLMTPFEWVELYLAHLLVYGNAFHLKVTNGAGGVEGLQPIPPTCVTVELEDSGAGGVMKTYRVSTRNGGERVYTDVEVLHTPGLSLDGILGLSPITIHRAALGTGLAGDQAAARMFGSGMLIGGMVTTDDDVTEDEAKMFKAYIDNRLVGVKNAGDIAFMNRKLSFQPWTQTAEDAQFLESRAFQIEEVARILGIPPHLLAQTDKQTSWGTGVAEQNVGLARYTFMQWTRRIEQRLSTQLKGRFCEFEYKGLFKGSPREELEMLKLQLDAGILTVDEARRILDMPPLAAPDPEESSDADQLG